MRHKALLLALVFVCVEGLLDSSPGVASERAASPAVTLLIKEVPVGKIDLDENTHALVISPDGKRVAYMSKRGDKWRVVVDGLEGKEYDGIMRDSAVFSPDSRRVAYVGFRGEGCVPKAVEKGVSHFS
jgi:hypothetical protein